MELKRRAGSSWAHVPHALLPLAGGFPSDHTQPRTLGRGWARVSHNHLSRAWDEEKANARRRLRFQAHSQRPGAPLTETGWETGSGPTKPT